MKDNKGGVDVRDTGAQEGVSPTYFRLRVWFPREAGEHPQLGHARTYLYAHPRPAQGLAHSRCSQHSLAG